LIRKNIARIVLGKFPKLICHQLFVLFFSRSIKAKRKLTYKAFCSWFFLYSFKILKVQKNEREKEKERDCANSTYYFKLNKTKRKSNKDYNN
jgi:hypothetical protein